MSDPGMKWEIREGDALERLREMSAESVQCVVTSPPYFGLRDYGTGEWDGGDDGCDHSHQVAPRRDAAGGEFLPTRGEQKARVSLNTVPFRDVCGKCGARRVDKQLGLEATPGEYVARLVEVFREVRRALRVDGTVWLNIGDSYNNRAVSRPSSHQGGLGFESEHLATSWRDHAASGRAHMSIVDGDLKEKDLLGTPWMLAFALRADGWYLRSEIVWAKPNPMPESVTDRPTGAHEKLFLLAKSPRYFYHADAIREPHSTLGIGPGPTGGWAQDDAGRRGADGKRHLSGHEAGRNKRNVWEIATQPFAEAHFATFPPKLVEPCILAGSAPGDLVLDPFAGAGTTGLVALRHDRSFVGIELNPAYAALARERIRGDAPLLNTPIEVAA